MHVLSPIVHCAAGCRHRRRGRGRCGWVGDYVYQGAENTLVGASDYIDVPFGTCLRAVYTTEMPDLKACADYAICDLCPDGENPCQL